MQTFRVMTFNVRGARFADGVNAWAARRDLNVRTLLRHAPDLIGFQEPQQANLDVYRDHLAGYDSEPGRPYNDTPQEYQYPAIFWNARRFERLDSGGFWISTMPDQYSRAWGTACIRSASWVRLRDRATGRVLVHLNTHLDHVAEQARVEGARLIVQRLAAAGGDAPLLVTGDFNCMPGSEPYRVLQQAGFADAYLAAGPRPAAHTFHCFQGEAYAPKPGEDDRMDWILTRAQEAADPVRVVSCDVIRDAEPPLFPSDHYPVLAVLAID